MSKVGMSIHFTLLEGRDVFVSLPNSFRKLFPLVFDYLTVESDGKSIVVVSPLIALMEDQVVSYGDKGIKVALIMKVTYNVDRKASISESAYQLAMCSRDLPRIF